MKSYPNQGMQGTARLWTLRSKFNTVLEMVSDLDIHLFKLHGVLEEFAIKISDDFKSKTFNDQSLQTKTSVGSSASVMVLRDSE